MNQRSPLLAPAILGLGFVVVVSTVVPRFVTRTFAESETRDATFEPASSTYNPIHEDSERRVTILSVTKGLAFLKSQEPIAAQFAGERQPGENVLPWLRVNVLVERLDGQTGSIGPVQLEIESDDCEEFVATLEGRRRRVSGSAVVALDHHKLDLMLFPFGPLTVKDADRSRVFSFSESGRFCDADKVTLRLSVGTEENRKEVLFENVPIP